MLATSTTYHPHAFLPAIPSPLSPRSANIYSRYPHRPSTAFMSSSSEAAGESTPKAPEANDRSVPFSRRPVKKAPSPKHDELQEKRRTAFLRRVQEGREEKRFAPRGDDIMRLDFLRTRRAWEAQQASAAIDLTSDWDVEEENDNSYDLPMSSSSAMQLSQAGERMDGGLADEVLQRERDELEALIGFMPSDGAVTADDGTDGHSEHFGSDDDEFEALFSELMDTERDATGTASGGDRNQHPEADTHALPEEEAMDTS